MIDHDQLMIENRFYFDNFLNKNVVVIVITSKHDFDKYKK